MAKKHKYFRNLDYKQKLETLYNNVGSRYPSEVKFITKECDMDAVKRDQNRYGIYRTLDWYLVKGTENVYEYWDRPTVPYKIIEVEHSRSGRRRFLKKYSNKLVRRTKDIYNHADYKKIFDLWWTLY